MKFYIYSPSGSKNKRNIIATLFVVVLSVFDYYDQYNAPHLSLYTFDKVVVKVLVHVKPNL